MQSKGLSDACDFNYYLLGTLEPSTLAFDMFTFQWQSLTVHLQSPGAGFATALLQGAPVCNANIGDADKGAPLGRLRPRFPGLLVHKWSTEV